MSESAERLIYAFINTTDHLVGKGILDAEDAAYTREAYLSAVREWLYEIPSEIREASKGWMDDRGR